MNAWKHWNYIAAVCNYSACFWAYSRFSFRVYHHMHERAELKAEWRVWYTLHRCRGGRGVITIKGREGAAVITTSTPTKFMAGWHATCAPSVRRRRTSPTVCCCELDLACGRTACISSPWVGSLPACRSHTHTAASATAGGTATFDNDVFITPRTAWFTASRC